MKDNILKCEYNMDNGYVEVYYKDGNMLRLKCEKVESRLRLTQHSQSKIWKLLDENPIERICFYGFVRGNAEVLRYRR